MDVNEGILNGWSNTGTSGHVAHPLGLFILKKGGHKFFIADITPVDFDSICAVCVGQKFQVGLLDSYIVVVVQFIDDDDIVTSLQKMFGDAASNETGTACDEDLFVSNMRLHDLSIAPC